MLAGDIHGFLVAFDEHIEVREPDGLHMRQLRRPRRPEAYVR
jgi:hypothetical protein